MRAGRMWQILRVSAVTAAMFDVVAGEGVARAQKSQTGTVPPASQSGMPTQSGTVPGMPPLDPAANMPDGGVRARMEQQRLKAVNDDRHKRLAADVDRLV